MEFCVRTRIDIDSALIEDVLKLSGMQSEEAAVEAALRMMSSRLRATQAIDALRDIGWEGDLANSRASRTFPQSQ
jgi:Arc/MetJ family transcription regulator